MVLAKSGLRFWEQEARGLRPLSWVERFPRGTLRFSPHKVNSEASSARGVHGGSSTEGLAQRLKHGEMSRLEGEKWVPELSDVTV